MFNQLVNFLDKKFNTRQKTKTTRICEGAADRPCKHPAIGYNRDRGSFKCTKCNQEFDACPKGYKCSDIPGLFVPERGKKVAEGGLGGSYKVLRSDGGVFLETTDKAAVQAAILKLDNSYKVKFPDGSIRPLDSASWEMDEGQLFKESGDIDWEDVLSDVSKRVGDNEDAQVEALAQDIADIMTKQGKRPVKAAEVLGWAAQEGIEDKGEQAGWLAGMLANIKNDMRAGKFDPEYIWQDIHKVKDTDLGDMFNRPSGNVPNEAKGKKEPRFADKIMQTQYEDLIKDGKTPEEAARKVHDAHKEYYGKSAKFYGVESKVNESEADYRDFSLAVLMGLKKKGIRPLLHGEGYDKSMGANYAEFVVNTSFPEFERLVDSIKGIERVGFSTGKYGKDITFIVYGKLANEGNESKVNESVEPGPDNKLFMRWAKAQALDPHMKRAHDEYKKTEIYKKDKEREELQDADEKLKKKKKPGKKKLNEFGKPEGFDLTYDDIMAIDVTDDQGNETTVGELLHGLGSAEKSTVLDIDVTYEGETYTVGELLSMINVTESKVNEKLVFQNEETVEVVYWNELTDEEKKEMDWAGEDDTFFRYGDNVYALSEFMRTEDEQRGGASELAAAGWQGYLGTSYWDGIVVSLEGTEERGPIGDWVRVAHFYQDSSESKSGRKEPVCNHKFEPWNYKTGTGRMFCVKCGKFESEIPASEGGTKESKVTESEYDGEKHGYICMTCGKTIHGGVNKDGECPQCVEEAEKGREEYFRKNENSVAEGEVSPGLKKWRGKQKPGAIMKPSTFQKIKRSAAAKGATDPEKVAGAAYWKTAKAKYAGKEAVEEDKGNRTTGAQRRNARFDKIWAEAEKLGAFSPENLAKSREWEEEMRKRKKNLPTEAKLNEHPEVPPVQPPVPGEPAPEPEEDAEDLRELEEWKATAKQELEAELGVKTKVTNYEYYTDMGAFTLEAVEGKANNGESEWIVFENIEDAGMAAVAQVREDLENEPEIFNQDWLSNHFDEEKYMDDVYSDIQEWVWDSPDSYTTFIDDEEPAEDGDYSEDQIDRMVNGYIESIMLQGVMDWLQHDLGYSGDNLAKHISSYIDFDAAAQDAVDVDGVAHFLDRYDGAEVELPSGAVAFGTN